MDRAGWKQLQVDIDSGLIDRLVVWRLDRLGRTASGLCKLFEDLQAKKVRLVSSWILSIWEPLQDAS